MSGFTSLKADADKSRAARRLCELFKGRLSEDVAENLIEDLGGELQAVDFMMNEDPEVVSEYFNNNVSYVEDVRLDSKNVATILENGIEYEERQFACGDCSRGWWKKVPARKQVSKCKRCHVKYDPVPRENEWGWAKFTCQCSNEFHAYGEMGVTESRCYKCETMVPVTRVLPPRKRIGARKKSNKQHSCNGINCFSQDVNNLAKSFAGMKMSPINSQFYLPGNSGAVLSYNKQDNVSDDGNAPTSTPTPTPMCMHPKSRNRNQIIRSTSRRHISTGSTVNTFLSQKSLETASISCAFDLAPIEELD